MSRPKLIKSKSPRGKRSKPSPAASSGKNTPTPQLNKMSYPESVIRRTTSDLHSRHVTDEVVNAVVSRLANGNEVVSAIKRQLDLKKMMGSLIPKEYLSNIIHGLDSRFQEAVNTGRYYAHSVDLGENVSTDTRKQYDEAFSDAVRELVMKIKADFIEYGRLSAEIPVDEK